MPAPRVVLVLAEQWPRALLRAELRERGYDAIGAPTLAAALVYPTEESGRGPVRLVVVDQPAFLEGGAASLERLRMLHPSTRVLLIASYSGEVPEGPWASVIPGPTRVDSVRRAIERLLPLRPLVVRAFRE